MLEELADQITRSKDGQHVPWGHVDGNPLRPRLPHQNHGHGAPRGRQHGHDHQGHDHQGHRHRGLQDGYERGYHRPGYGHPGNPRRRDRPHRPRNGDFGDQFPRHRQRPHGYESPENRLPPGYHLPPGYRHRRRGEDNRGPPRDSDGRPTLTNPFITGDTSSESNSSTSSESESNDDFAPGPSPMRGHGAHGRDGERRPGNPFGGRPGRPRYDSGSDGDLPFGGNRRFPGGFNPHWNPRRGPPEGRGQPGGRGPPGGRRPPGGRGPPGGRRPRGPPPPPDIGMSQLGSPPPEEEKPNFYEVLEVPETATAEECQKAGKIKLIKVHPDKHPEDREDPVKLKHWTDESAKITEAQNTLGDKRKKAMYDRQLRMKREFGIS
ncbi:MAG: hypothetical protein M1812_005428 [Candelaria pacifica]|nr:MAG: hypothetical protein M1812_005428 [Candelaria pacifica]